LHTVDDPQLIHTPYCTTRSPHGSKCWLYFPESDCPFYRATVFSNYAEANCPSAARRLPTLCTGDGRPPGSQQESLLQQQREQQRAGSSGGGDDGGASSSGRTAAAGGATQEEGGPYWSLMFEISESAVKPVNQRPVSLGGSTWPQVVRETLLGAVSTRLVRPEDEVVSIYHRRLEHGAF
jgi:hypothetical protein